MELSTTYSYTAILELPTGGKQVVWLTSSSLEEAKKEAKEMSIKHLYEHKTTTTVERFEIE